MASGSADCRVPQPKVNFWLSEPRSKVAGHHLGPISPCALNVLVKLLRPRGCFLGKNRRCLSNTYNEQSRQVAASLPCENLVLHRSKHCCKLVPWSLQREARQVPGWRCMRWAINIVFLCLNNQWYKHCRGIMGFHALRAVILALAEKAHCGAAWLR